MKSMESECASLRIKVQLLANEVLCLRGHEDLYATNMSVPQRSEAEANITLTFRHLEDARMRLGKVMQQLQGGVSILDDHDKELAHG